MDSLDISTVNNFFRKLRRLDYLPKIRVYIDFTGQLILYYN